MADEGRNVRVWGIIPAAGLSRRMGRPKQSLPFQGSTIVAAVAHTLLEADVSGLVVVTRTELIDELRLPADSRVHVVVNDDPESEMIDSIRIGLSGLSRFRPAGADGVLVVPADMPTLSAGTCRACITAYESAPRRIVIATHGGRRGHPIVFPFALRRTVESLKGGLRELPRICSEQVLLLEIDDPAVELDIDTVDDYEQL
jgi:molybdenum cofactor cytidylyltransferase